MTERLKKNAPELTVGSEADLPYLERGRLARIASEGARPLFPK